MASAGVLVLSACGGGGYSVSGVAKPAAAAPPTQGNWYLAATSSSLASGSGPVITSYSGPLAVSGGMASVTTIGNGSCFPASALVLSGPTSDNSISFSSPQSTISGFILTVTGNLTNGTNIDATYQLAGGTNSSLCRADVGTVYGTYVPTFNGSWTGTVNENQYPSSGVNGMAPVGYTPNAAGMSVVTTQATTAVSFPNPGGGTISAFPLSGTVTWTNANCYSSGTIDPTQSYIVGNTVDITVIKAAGGYATYSFGTTLAQPINGPLTTFTVLLQPVGGPCDQYTVSGTLPAASQ
jgi:hypothetical protein